MWLAKFKIWHKDCTITPLCVKFKVTDFVHLINYWEKEKRFYYTERHILQGTEKNIKKFVKKFKKEKSLIKMEQKGNVIFSHNFYTADKNYWKVVFNPKIIQVKPVIIKTDGIEYWELASWDKKSLMKILNLPYKVKLISIQNTKLIDVFLPRLYPKLPPKQKVAIELAVKSGYYNYPRKVDLETLGKMSKVKRQTFQENLRRAEKKLIPFLTESVS